jgi:hypothetical protein
MPVKLSQRIVFAEIDSEDSNPHSIFDFHDTHIAKQEAVEVCEYIAERIFSDD